MKLTGSKLAVVSIAALATVACNGNQPPPPSNNQASPGPIKVASTLPTDQILNLGIKYQPAASATYTKGIVVIESDLAAGMTVDARIVIKRTGAADVTKTVTLAAGKGITTVPLLAADLGKVTEISWKETPVDPAQWKFTRHKTTEYNPASGNIYIATSDVTTLGEVECCPGEAAARGIFTTPIGLRVYLQ